MLGKLFKRWDKKPSQEEIRQQIVAAPEWRIGLKRYFSTPLPNLNASLKDLEFVALDFETTGLDLSEDKILSIGFVPLTVQGIDIGQTGEILVNHGEFVKAASAEVNQLTPQRLAKGESCVDAMDKFFHAAAGKVILAHSANIERAFIERHMRQNYQSETFPAYFLDTLQLEKRFSYQGRTGAHSSFQLDDLRSFYGLPSYHSHSAASDALACAELFTVQFKKLLKTSDLKLKDLVV